MTSGERTKIERSVTARSAGNADFIVAGIVVLVTAALVVGIAIGWFAGTWWLP